MSEVSYQAILGPAAVEDQSGFEPLPSAALSTRRKNATKTLKVDVSKKQRAWLDRVEAISGEGIDRDAVVRALIDVGRELDIDWALLAGASNMREAIRESLRVRRAT